VAGALDMLRDQELLLTQDNCEHVVHGADGGAILADCPGIALLAASELRSA
jgi:hypothetical protein